MNITDDEYSLIASRHRHGAAWDRLPLTEQPANWSRAWPWLALIALLVVAGRWAFA
jgi:hypothetical protein